MDKESQTTEVRESVQTDGANTVRRQTVATASTADGRVVMSRVVWYIAGFIITLLVLRVIMFLLGANQGAGFVDFIYSVSGVFAAPFVGIFPTPAYGASALDTASLVAIVVYALVAWGIGKLIMLSSARETV